MTFVLRLSLAFPFHPLPSSLAAHTRGRKTRLCFPDVLRSQAPLTSSRQPTRDLQILSEVTSSLVEHRARILLVWMLAEAVVGLLWVQRFPFLISRQRQQHPSGLILQCCSGSHFQKLSLEPSPLAFEHNVFNLSVLKTIKGFPGGSVVNNAPANAGSIG